MGDNRLFVFVKKELIDKNSVDDVIDARKFIPKEDKQKNKLIIVPLAKDKTVTLIGDGKQYSLKNHHISLYETLFTGDFSLGEYHYTAYVTDEENQEYQFHLFFNKDDNRTIKAQFSIRQGKEFSKEKISEEFSETLTQLAIMQSSKIISHLRKLRERKISLLKSELATNEAKLDELSKDIDKNQVTYLQLLATAENILNQIISYHDNREYQSLKRFFAQLKLSLIAPRAKITSTEVVETETLDDLALPSGTQEEVMPVMKKARQSINRVVLQIEEKRAEFVELMKDTSTTFSSKVSAFCAGFSDAKQAFLLADDEAYVSTFSELKRIRRVVTENEKSGVALLENALLMNEFDSANVLKMFVEPILEKMVKMALATGNSKMLDFLLTNGELDIDAFHVLGSLTPVLFCFYKHSEKGNKAN